MAEITALGVQPDGLTGFVTRLEGAFRDALGNDLNVDPETPQGQLIGELGIVLTEVEELALHVAAGLSLDTIEGRQITDWGTLLDLALIPGQRSTVTARLSGDAGVAIPVGSRVQTVEGAVFVTDVQTRIEAGGTVDVLCRAQEFGLVIAPANTLTRIIDARAGWRGVTNPDGAILGRDVETAVAYKRRYSQVVATHARDAIEAVRARVLQVDGVTDALVRDNATGATVTIQSIDIEAGALLVIVQGGADADVAEAIAQTKPAGCPTSGDETVNWAHPGGFTVPIKFRRVEEVPLVVTVTLTIGPAFPADGLATMRRNLVQWFTGEWPVPGPGIFDQTGIAIAESVDLARLNTPLNAVPGHTIQSVTVQRDTDPVEALGTPNLDQRYTLTAENVTFSVTS